VETLAARQRYCLGGPRCAWAWVGGMKGQALVLNQNYEPLNITSWRRAIALIVTGKAVVLEEDSEYITTPTRRFRMPSVVRLRYLVRRPLPELKLSRHAILTRDNYTCQYCGRQTRTLTIDHVIPREQGGTHTWENLVACCPDCNHKKGNRSPQAAGMQLRRPPQRPRLIPYLSYSTFRAALRHKQWRDYLEPFAPHLLDG
jgi:5-methylcytosine-specific restriction endonuclease McrA